MRVLLRATSDEVARAAADMVEGQIRSKPDSVLGLATGGTVTALYSELIRRHRETGLDFSRVTTFNLDEYVDLGPDHPQSYRHFMRERLFAHVNLSPDRIHLPDGLATDLQAECQRYEQDIERAGGIDLQILGIGADGHIAFNEPGSSLGSRTRLKALTDETRRANARFFSDLAEVPHIAITMGVGSILATRRCMLLACGESKAKAVKAMVEGPVTSQVTASALQHHADVTALLDADAAALLENKDYYHSVERAEEWVERRARGR